MEISIFIERTVDETAITKVGESLKVLQAANIKTLIQNWFTQYYVITQVAGAEMGSIACSEKSQNILTNRGMPFTHSKDRIFNLELASRFRKSFFC